MISELKQLIGAFVLNAPFSCATASLAIGDYVADRYAENFS